MNPLFGILSSLIAPLLDRIPDPNARATAKEELEKQLVGIVQEATAGQIEVNKTEAAHRSIFVAGWRPAIGWVCAVSLGTYYVPALLVGNALWVWACVQSGSMVERPEMDVTEILGLVGTLLGMGGLRTVEKLRNVA